MPRVWKKCDKKTFKKTQRRNSPRIGGSAKSVFKMWTRNELKSIAQAHENTFVTKAISM